MVIDSLYNDTTIVFDPETYTETVTVTRHTKYSIKCGEWKEVTAEGVKIEVFEECEE